MKLLIIKHLCDYGALTFYEYYKSDWGKMIDKYSKYECGDYEEEIDGIELEFEIKEVDLSEEAYNFCREFMDTEHTDIINLQEWLL